MGGGSIMALPHPHRRNQPTPNRFTATSTHNESFREVPHCYASMDKKPYMPYDPNATRSRLAQEDAPVPLKNASTIEFRGHGVVHKRWFVTTHKNNYTGSMPDLRSNTSMIATDTVNLHRHQET